MVWFVWCERCVGVVCKVCGCGVWDVCGVCTGGALVYNTTQLVALLPCHLSIVVCVHLCHVPTQAKGTIRVDTFVQCWHWSCALVCDLMDAGGWRDTIGHGALLPSVSCVTTNATSCGTVFARLYFHEYHGRNCIHKISDWTWRVLCTMKHLNRPFTWMITQTTNVHSRNFMSWKLQQGGVQWDVGVRVYVCVSLHILCLLWCDFLLYVVVVYDWHAL